MEYIEKYQDLSFEMSRETNLNNELFRLEYLKLSLGMVISQMSLVRAVSRYKVGEIPYVNVMEAIKNYRECVEQLKRVTRDAAGKYPTIAELIRAGDVNICSLNETQGLGTTSNTKSEGVYL